MVTEGSSVVVYLNMSIVSILWGGLIKIGMESVGSKETLLLRHN